MAWVLSPQGAEPFQFATLFQASVEEEHVDVGLVDLASACLAHVEKPTGFRKAFASEHCAGEFDVSGFLFWLAHGVLRGCWVVLFSC